MILMVMLKEARKNARVDSGALCQKGTCTKKDEKANEISHGSPRDLMTLEVFGLRL